MIVGEAPSEEEDIAGNPFIGDAGAKLDSILNYVGVSREEIYITNSVLCRPPNNRSPRPEELFACRSRLFEQIELIRPPVIVLLGKIATQQVLMDGKPFKGALSQYFSDKTQDGWIKINIGNHESKVLVTYHPSYHLRSPDRAYKTTLPHWTQLKEWVDGQKSS
jgi:DNA polymerase